MPINSLLASTAGSTIATGSYRVWVNSVMQQTQTPLVGELHKPKILFFLLPQKAYFNLLIS